MRSGAPSCPACRPRQSYAAAAPRSRPPPRRRSSSAPRSAPAARRRSRRRPRTPHRPPRRPPPRPRRSRSARSRSSSRSASSSSCASRARRRRPTSAARCAAARPPGRSCSATTSSRPSSCARSRGSCAAGRRRRRSSATDQEGGAIRNLRWAPPHTGQSGQIPGRDARAAARALRQAGINVTLGAGRRRAVGGRCGDGVAGVLARRRGRRPRRCARPSNGWRAGGVAATAKHFPGLGGATMNTDHGSAMIDGAPTGADLVPFRAAIQARVPLIMSSHARYPRLDGDRIASQSPKILRTLLRDQLKLRGRRDDGLDRGRRRARDRHRPSRSRCARSAPATTSCSRPARARGCGSIARCSREARASRSFRARVEASAARVTALQDTLE